MPIPIYCIKNVHVFKDNVERLQIKQFDIHRGACYVFEGRMGSGKTIFLDILYSRRNIGEGKIEFENPNKSLNISYQINNNENRLYTMLHTPS